MKDFLATIRLPVHEEAIAPVTIFDGQGSVVRVVPAVEFRRLHPSSVNSSHAGRSGRRRAEPVELV